MYGRMREPFCLFGALCINLTGEGPDLRFAVNAYLPSYWFQYLHEVRQWPIENLVASAWLVASQRGPFDLLFSVFPLLIFDATASRLTCSIVRTCHKLPQQVSAHVCISHHGHWVMRTNSTQLSSL